MIHSDKCPICSSPAKISALTQVEDKKLHDVTCIRCGKYSYEWELDIDMGSLSGNLSAKEKAKISAILHHHPHTVLTNENFEGLLNFRIPSVGNRAEELLIELGNRYPDIGSRITNLTVPLFSLIKDIESSKMNTEYFTNGKAEELLPLLSLTSSQKPSELVFLLEKYLATDEGYLEILGNCVYRITPMGWNRIHELENESINSMQGFVAMDFSADLKPIYFAGIKLGIDAAGYSPKIMHDHDHNNWIADEIMVQIRRSRFVVADVTRQNQGVYFEAGFALGLGIPVIWICTEMEFKKRHFDTAQINTIKYSENDLPGLIKVLKHRIENTIKMK